MVHKNIAEGIRYTVVGVLTTAVNYIFYGGFDFLFEKMGIPSVLSYKLAYGIAFSAINIWFFERRRESSSKKFCLFLLFVYHPGLRAFSSWYFWWMSLDLPIRQGGF